MLLWPTEAGTDRRGPADSWARHGVCLHPAWLQVAAVSCILLCAGPEKMQALQLCSPEAKGVLWLVEAVRSVLGRSTPPIRGHCELELWLHTCVRVGANRTP
jgi:hypothetical protein